MYHIKTSFHRAFQYTVLLSVLYTLFKVITFNAPLGSEFFSYIVPLVLTNIVLLAFPLLFVFFYFRDGDTLDTIKENILDKANPKIKNQEILREYHSMLKEGIITQDEFDSIKKKYLKELHKS